MRLLPNAFSFLDSQLSDYHSAALKEEGLVFLSLELQTSKLFHFGACLGKAVGQRSYLSWRAAETNVNSECRFCMSRMLDGHGEYDHLASDYVSSSTQPHNCEASAEQCTTAPLHGLAPC